MRSSQQEAHLLHAKRNLSASPTSACASVVCATGAGSEIATSANLTNRYINLAVTRFVGNLFDLTILEISRFSDVTIYKT